MELINPNMLWGLAAIAAPILIHFWNQKKATTVNWAAMKWLLESQKLRAKGFRFQDFLLLLLRVLAITLLALILAKPILERSLFGKDKTPEKIHIIEQTRKNLDYFKYEINQAFSKNEWVFWANDMNKRVTNVDDFVEQNPINISDIQTITNISSKKYPNRELNLYISDQKDLGVYPTVFVAQKYKIHFGKDPEKNNGTALLNKQYFYVESTLSKSSNAPKGRNIVKRDTLSIAIRTKNLSEEKSIKAAFEALSEVYGFNFGYDKLKKNPDIAIGQLDTNEDADLKIQTGSLILKNKYYLLNESLDEKSSGLVFRSELPERILEIVLKHFGIESFQTVMSQKQLNAVFQVKSKSINSEGTQLNKYLMFLFLITTITERWISLKNNK